MKTLTPLFQWNTGRRREIEYIKPFLPNYVKENLEGGNNKYTYVEPFVGGGALYFYLNNINGLNIINDWVEEMMWFYEAVKTQDEKFLNIVNEVSQLYNKDFVAKVGKEKALKLQSEMYYTIRNLDRDIVKMNEMTNAEKGARFWIISQLAYNAERRYNGKGQFNVAYNKAKNLSIKKLTNKNYIQLLQHTLILSTDYSFLLKDSFIDQENTFIFGDPPYVNAMKKNNATMDGLFDDTKQEEVADYFKNIKNAQWMVLIDDTKATRSFYKDYIKTTHYLRHVGARHLIATNY